FSTRRNRRSACRFRVEITFPQSCSFSSNYRWSATYIWHARCLLKGERGRISPCLGGSIYEIYFDPYGACDVVDYRAWSLGAGVLCVSTFRTQPANECTDSGRYAERSNDDVRNLSSASSDL